MNKYIVNFNPKVDLLIFRKVRNLFLSSESNLVFLTQRRRVAKKKIIINHLLFYKFHHVLKLH
jgi:hypothetical protein